MTHVKFKERKIRKISHSANKSTHRDGMGCVISLQTNIQHSTLLDYKIRPGSWHKMCSQQQGCLFPANPINKQYFRDICR